MGGFWDRYYWGRRERENVEGIVVVFAWMYSDENQLKKFVNLYSSFGWNSLVCHSKVLNLFFPEKAASLAQVIVNMLVEELKLRPCPVVFASFCGGPKACAYKVFQIIDHKSQEQEHLDDYHLVRDCVAGFIFDSSPVDFITDYGTRFILHPTVLKMSRPPLIARWIAKGHYRNYPGEYTAAVAEMLGKASQVYSKRMQQLEGEKMGSNGTNDECAGPVNHLRKAMASSSLSPNRVALDLNKNNYVLVPSSEGYHEVQDLGSVPDEYREPCTPLSTPPRINPHGLLGQLLFDVCLPKNVDDWDMKRSRSSNRPIYSSPFNPIKCIFRSRL